MQDDKISLVNIKEGTDYMRIAALGGQCNSLLTMHVIKTKFSNYFK